MKRGEGMGGWECTVAMEMKTKEMKTKKKEEKEKEEEEKNTNGTAQEGCAWCGVVC